MSLPMHPLAELFPPMSDMEFTTLVADIKENGLREPIIVYEGQVLDGRNRYRACLEIGIEPMTRPWDGKGDPLDFVVSKNLHRRHLDESQRAMVADKIATLKHGTNRFSKVDASIDASTPISQSQAAEMMNVSRKSVQRARVVRERGVPELQSAVETGNVSLSAAAAVAYKAPDEQREIVSQGPQAIVKAAKTAKAAAVFGPKLSIVPAAAAQKATHGGRVSVPDGTTIEEQTRKAMILEANGLSAEKAAKQVGIGDLTYRRVRDLVVLLEEINLNSRDRHAVSTALGVINETKQITSYDAVEPIVRRVWGSNKNNHHTIRTASKRVEHFATVVGSAVSACEVLMMDEVEVPYLSDDDLRRWTIEVESARRSLGAFLKKLNGA